MQTAVGSLECCQLLLEVRGLKLTTTRGSEETPLHFAARHGWTQVIREIRMPPPFPGRMCLIVAMAIACGATAVILVLSVRALVVLTIRSAPCCWRAARRRLACCC